MHRGRRQHHGNVRDAALEGGHDIVQRSRPQRGHQPNATRYQGQRALTGRGKQPFCFQFGLEPQELLKPGALPGSAHALDDELQVTAGLVDTQAAAHFNQLTVARRKVQQTGSPAEHSTANLPAFIFQGQIAVATGSARKTCNFAPHSHRVEAGIKRIGHGATERPHLPDAGGQRRR